MERNKRFCEFAAVLEFVFLIFIPKHKIKGVFSLRRKKNSNYGENKKTPTH